MKFRHIIENFSVVLLSIMLCSILEAQDLEEVLPRKVDVSIIDYSEDLEPSFLLSEEMDTSSIAPLDSQYLEIVNQVEAEQENIVSKEAQLGMILRNAYYQKITSPRWAKILSTQSWKASFLKWRYYAQIEDYIRSSSSEVVKMKSKPPLTITHIVAKENEDISEVFSDTLENDYASSIRLLKEPKPPKEEMLSENRKETTEEETFDNDSVAIDMERFLFSITDLSLPDSILSERSLYPKELIATKELEADPKPIGVETSEIKKNVEDPKAQLKEIVSSKVEEPKFKEPKVESREEVQSKVEKEVVASSTDIKKPEPPQNAAPTSTAKSVNRRTITEQFASTYSRLPWPVSGGNITDRYGYRRNAEARGLKRENYGIDISAPSASRVKAVFSGTVLMAIRQAPYDYIVTLKHGDFTTAYYFLNTVNVKVGDIVTTGQILGNLRQQPELAPFHFEIWQDQERINPEPWLKS